MRKILAIFFIIILTLTLASCNKFHEEEVLETHGTVTVSQGQYYPDAGDGNVTLFVNENSDADEDNVVLTEKNVNLNFEATNLVTGKTLYVMQDGNIDDVLGEFDIEGQRPTT